MPARLLAAVVTTLLLGMATPARAGLLHAYDFEAGVIDLVGGVDGTLEGVASVSGGTLNLGNVGLDQGGWVEFGVKLIPLTGSYTVALFARIDVLDLPATEFISQGASVQLGDPLGGFYLGTVGSSYAMRATDSWQAPDVQFPSDGAFHHVALVVDAAAGESRLYIDGVEEDSLPSAIETTANGLGTQLGRQFEALNPEFLFGSLDNVLIYDQALTPGQVAQLAAGEIIAATVPALGPSPLLLLAAALAATSAVLASRLRRDGA